jgi:hypothetical protein
MKRIIPATAIILYLLTSLVLQTWVDQGLADIYLFWGLLGAVTDSEKRLNSRIDWLIGFPYMIWILILIILYLLIKNPKTCWSRLKIVFKDWNW